MPLRRQLELYAAACRRASVGGTPLPPPPNTDFCGADLTGADLTGVKLRSVNLTGADLYGANLRSADLRGTIFEEADLSGANLRSVDLTGSVLRRAVLRGADFRGVDFAKVDLRGVNFRGADLTGAKRYRFPGAPDPMELRDAVARQIRGHPELHDQTEWGNPTRCDTPCCVAGWAVRLGGGTRGEHVWAAAVRLLWADGVPMPPFEALATREEILAALDAKPSRVRRA